MHCFIDNLLPYARPGCRLNALSNLDEQGLQLVVVPVYLTQRINSAAIFSLEMPTP